jgi:hypothetical protein
MTPRMKTPTCGALFLLLFAAGCHGTFRHLPEQGGPVETSRVEPRLSRVGSTLVGKEIEVRCWSQRDWRQQIEDREANAEHEFAGMASEGGPVDLAPDACAPLVEIMYRHEKPVTREQEVVLAYSVGVLAHELEHVRGELDEEIAECFGMQRLAGVARELGLPADEARRLARVYWTDVYLDSAQDYRAPDCRNGRKLDLRRRTAVWP